MDIGFIIKKTITFFVEPMGFILLLFALGLYFLYVGKNRFAKILLSASFGFLFLFSYPPFSNFLIKHIEERHEKYDYSKKIKYIHVLGGGHTIDETQPLSSSLSDASVKRVLEGVIIHKRTPNSKIIFTGYGGKIGVPAAITNTKLALELGVKKEDIIVGIKPKDTYEEAEFSKSIVGEKEFVLVTSATHMPRSMMLFKSNGMNPIAAPTYFKKSGEYEFLQPPSTTSLERSRMAIHEYLGILWAKIRG
ncbi:ElyC/SanA/YdcF family protein [Sulfurimonas sp.]|uniref:ElyC/SanA/YdcF family protein n=1 Tax=Sulfurimonas sp. TaxID=2022749 RepID=UPI0035670B35